MALGYQNSFYLKQAQQKQQSLYNGKVLLEKHDPSVVYDSKETMKQLNKEIKLANYAKINQLLKGFVSQKAKLREELYFSNTSKTASVSKSVSKLISIPNEEFSNDTSPSVARKFLNEVKGTIVTLQRAVKQKMTLDIHNWSFTAHQELHKIVKDEILPIVNQVEADASLDKHKALEFEIKCLLRAVVSQDIMSIVKNHSVVDTSDLQTELEPYNDMQHQIERLQAQLGDLKGKSSNTQCASNTLDPLSQKLDDENMELEFQFSEQKDTSKGTNVNTKFAKPSILGKPPSSSGTKLYSVTPFPNTLSKLVTLHSVPNTRESKVVKNNNVIALGMFRTNPLKNSRVDNFVPNKHVKACIRTKPITISQPHIVTKKDDNSNRNGLPSTGVESTTKTKRPQPRSNLKNDRIPSASKSSCLSNNLEKVEEHHRNLQFSKTLNHRSSEGNNIKLAIRNEESEVVCATCKQCLITANHDECVFKYVNDMNSSKKNQSANV
ncbi:hypothetical protein Tco_0971654 [Tanacetum coccineum]